MSKYASRGAYHYDEFNDDTTYRAHVLDLVQKIEDHTDKRLLLPKVIEIGSGEGLILDQLTRKGFTCEGCDIDSVAVGLAKIYKNRVYQGSIENFKGRTDASVVLLCDVLEHVESPIAVMAAAREFVGKHGIVVIAIPDRKDKHAINAIGPGFIHLHMEPHLKCVHESRRHARHLMIFEWIPCPT